MIHRTVSKGSKGREAFSLIEMLTVVAIASVFMSLAASSTGALRDSYRVAGGKAQMSSAIDQARSYALAHDSSVYLVFSGGREAFPADTDKKSFAIFSQEGTAQPKQVSKWEVLPGDMSFEVEDGASVFQSGEIIEVSVPDEEGEKVVELPCLTFAPDGSLAGPTDPNLSRVVLNSGKYANQGKGYVISLAVSPSTGRVASN